MGIAKFDGMKSVKDLGKLMLNISNNSIMNYNLLNLFNIKYVVVPYPIDKEGMELFYNKKEYPVKMWGKEHENKEIFVYENTHYLNRIFIVYEYSIPGNSKEYLEFMTSSDFSDVVILGKNPNVEVSSSSAEKDCDYVDITRLENTKYTAEACLVNEGFVVFSSSWYPGWKV
jgi:hypothetical protein